MGVWELRPIAECIEVTGKKPVKVRWVDANKGDDDSFWPFSRYSPPPIASSLRARVLHAHVACFGHAHGTRVSAVETCPNFLMKILRRGLLYSGLGVEPKKLVAKYCNDFLMMAQKPQMSKKALPAQNISFASSLEGWRWRLDFDS